MGVVFLILLLPRSISYLKRQFGYVDKLYCCAKNECSAILFALALTERVILFSGSLSVATSAVCEYRLFCHMLDVFSCYASSASIVLLHTIVLLCSMLSAAQHSVSRLDFLYNSNTCGKLSICAILFWRQLQFIAKIGGIWPCQLRFAPDWPRFPFPISEKLCC